jgi:hypothetical protein
MLEELHSESVETLIATFERSVTRRRRAMKWLGIISVPLAIYGLVGTTFMVARLVTLDMSGMSEQELLDFSARLNLVGTLCRMIAIIVMMISFGGTALASLAYLRWPDPREKLLAYVDMHLTTASVERAHEALDLMTSGL